VEEEWENSDDGLKKARGFELLKKFGLQSGRARDPA
jgi:hypothetical protein